MKSDNYFVVFGWMMNELELSGNALLVYAVIYGFSQDGQSNYKGGRSYMSKTLNISKPTVDKALRYLCEKGYVHQMTIIVNGVAFNEYRADLEVVKNLYHRSNNLTPPGKETLLPSKETLPPPGKETLPSNKSKGKKVEIKDGIYRDVLESVPLIAENKDLYDAFIDFVEMRKKAKKPLTERALKLLVNRCFELANGDEEKMVKILDRSIRKMWLDVYPLKDDSRVKRNTNVEASSSNPFTELKKAEGMI